MSYDKAVFVAQRVTRDDLEPITKAFGGDWYEDEWRFSLERGRGYLLVSFYPGFFHELEDEADIPLVTQRLGTFPQTALLVSINNDRDKEMGKIALQLCIRIAEQWGAVVDNLNVGDDLYVFTLDQLKKMADKAGTWLSVENL